MLLDSELVGGQDVTASSLGVGTRSADSKRKGFRANEITGDSAAAWNDRKLAISLIYEGQRFIDGKADKLQKNKEKQN